MPSLRVLCCLALLSKTKGIISSRSASTLSSQILHRVAVCNRSPSKPLIPFNLAESVNLDNPLGLVDEGVVATIGESMLELNKRRYKAFLTTAQRHHTSLLVALLIRSLRG